MSDQAARENMIHTYADIARHLPGSHVTSDESLTLCRCPLRLSLGNFGIGIRTTDEHIQALADRLYDIGIDNSVFRLFTVTGDEPKFLRKTLTKTGFQSLGKLSQLVSTVPGEALANFQEETTPDGRLAATQFMVASFFWRRDQVLRKHVAQATASSSHQVYTYRRNGKIIGAVMLSETPSSIGLYNLCVESNERKQGIGRRIVLACQEVAHTNNLPLILQCDDSLAPWYARLLFISCGEVETFAAKPLNFL